MTALPVLLSQTEPRIPNNHWKRGRLGGFPRFFVSWSIDEIGQFMSLASSRIAFLEKAQESLESVFPGSMVYNGSTFACSRSGLEVVQGAEPGGFENEGRVMVRVRTANLPAAGLPRETAVTLDSVEYRVEECLLEPGDVAWSVELETV